MDNLTTRQRAPRGDFVQNGVYWNYVAEGSGGELEWGRARQGLIPDFRLRLPTQEGTSDCLAELKVVSAGATWYPRGVKVEEQKGGLDSCNPNTGEN